MQVSIDRINTERQFQLLVEAVVEYAIYMLDPTGRVTNWNSGAQRIKGYRPEEIIGEHFSRFYTEEDRNAGVPAQALKIAAKEGKFEAEGWRVRKDGGRFWASVLIDPIRDERGQLIGFAKVTRDITEQRETQRKLDETREQLFQAQKMEAIGQLTAGVAHDFNNLLTVVLSGAELAERLAGDNDKLKRILGNVRHAAMRGESLTKQLLIFSRKQQLRPDIVDLKQQLRSISDLLSRSLRGDIAIVTDIAIDLWPVEVDASQFELSMLNVGFNGRDAMPNGGTLRISAHNVSGYDPRSGLTGDFVVTSVEDTGVGMTEEVRAHALEPFFTTKEVGTGLGLSQAYGFARQSGGTLLLDSAVDRGTKVTFYLPAARSVPAPPLVEDVKSPERAAATGTILVVEDDLAVAELAVDLLERAGYLIKRAPDARTALRILGSGEKIDLVFSDIMLPGSMNGAELARAIREGFPGVFVLLATGYAESAGKIACEVPLITKPYGEQQLLRRIGNIIGDAQ